MKFVKLCVECKWSKPEKGFEHNLRCLNPNVNRKDAWALSGTNYQGSSAYSERNKIGIFSQCGMSGKLWESK